MDHIKKQPTAAGTLPNDTVEMCLADPNLLDRVSTWSLDFRQLEPGPMTTRIRLRQGRVLNLLEIAMDRAVHQTGLAPPGTVSFGIPLSEGINHWHNRHPDPDGLLSFGTTDGFEGVSNASFQGLTLSVDQSAIEALCASLGVPFPTSLAAGGVVADTAGHASLPSITRKVLAYLDGGSPSCRNTEEEILAAMLNTCASHRSITDRSTAHARARALRVALEFMEQSAEENPPLSLICETAAVSERTLNRAFNERFGVGPKAYLLRLRLGRVHQDLLRHDPAELVSCIANRWGFWHMGQFAKDYQAHFGKLPSDTLRQTTTHRPV